MIILSSWKSFGLVTCWTMSEAFVVVVQPRSSASQRSVFSRTSSEVHAATTNPLSYSIASEPLSNVWMQLVQEGNIAATMDINDEDGTTEVRYGVTWQDHQFREFVEGTSPRIQEIQALLNESQSPRILTTINDEGWMVQLPWLRTLRPPPSPGFSGATSSVPPPYDATTDSFVTGPLRLQLRPVVATLSSLPSQQQQQQVTTTTTPWQVFPNISPADVRGHFLLLPTLEEPDTNWRAQILTPDDCRDLVHLTASIAPAGSLLIGFNSVGAAASQNHIHAHAWPAWDYAVTNATEIFDYFDLENGVEVTWLEYPVFCIEMSGTDGDALGKAVAEVLACMGDAPYNVGFMNRQEEESDEIIVTDVYIFARSKERSPLIPELKLGISEMMGVFHAQSQQEFDLLATDDIMARALSDVTYFDENALWTKVQETLAGAVE